MWGSSLQPQHQELHTLPTEPGKNPEKDLLNKDLKVKEKRLQCVFHKILKENIFALYFYTKFLRCYFFNKDDILKCVVFV